MADQRDALKEQYKIAYENKDSAYVKEDLEKGCIHFLENIDKNSCFKLLPFYDAQKEFQKKIRKENITDLHNLEFALENLERYTLNLLTKPWCKDFYTIKICNGFFKYKIEQWISFDIASKILELIGYHKTAPGIYARDVDMPVDERVLVVSFELYLARTLTKLFRETHNICSSVDHLMDDDSKLKISSNLEKCSLEGENVDKLEEIMRRNTVTKHECKHYNKNGQSTQQDVISHDSPFLPKLPSLNIDDELLYGNETDPSFQTNISGSYQENIVESNPQMVGFACGYGDFTEQERYTGKASTGLYENVGYNPVQYSSEQGNIGGLGYGHISSTRQRSYKISSHCDRYQNDPPSYSSMPTVCSPQHKFIDSRFKDDFRMKSSKMKYDIKASSSTKIPPGGSVMARGNTGLPQTLEPQQMQSLSHSNDYDKNYDAQLDNLTNQGQKPELYGHQNTSRDTIERVNEIFSHRIKSKP